MECAEDRCQQSLENFCDPNRCYYSDPDIAALPINELIMGMREWLTTNPLIP